VLAAGISAVEAKEAISRKVIREGDELRISGHPFNLMEYGRVVVVSIGKAAWGMATAIAGILGSRVDEVLVVTKSGLSEGIIPVDRFTLIEAGHPIPNEESLKAGQFALELAQNLTSKDLLICLISGGGSALVTAPVDGVGLTDIQSITNSLLTCGASIAEINTLRRGLDRVKGGGLLRAAGEATVVSLIISDVVGDWLEAIASGPTSQNPTTTADGLNVLKKYGVADLCPRPILEALIEPSEGQIPELSQKSAFNYVIANNLEAVEAVLRQAELEGFISIHLRMDLQGEAKEAGSTLGSELKRISYQKQLGTPPICLVAGGETTVTVLGDGVGGRNTELALAASIDLDGIPDVLLVTLATDGEDGSTDAAGAVVTGNTLQSARALGMDASDFLSRNDSYNYFSALGDLIKPGLTGTNVNDLALLFAF
jgi:glycerate 2-kinase